MNEAGFYKWKEFIILHKTMLWSAKKLRGYTLKAREGQIGSVSDLFLHDQTWFIKCLVGKLGTWPHGKESLIGAKQLGTPLEEKKEIVTSFTKAHIQQRPLKGTNPPVSEQEPVPLPTSHHELPFQGRPEGFSPLFPGMQPGTIVVVEAAKELMKAQRHLQKPPSQNPPLRSTKEMSGYRLKTSDGKKARLEDFLLEVNNEAWQILWVDASVYKWWPGKKSLAGDRNVFTWGMGKAGSSRSIDTV